MISTAPDTAPDTASRKPRPEGADLVSLLTGARSVAIIGASTKPGTYPHRAMTYMRDYGFTGRLELVNPNRDEIEGLQCRQSIAELADNPVDLALVATAAEHVIESVAELAGIGVKSAIIIAAGLGADAKAELAEIGERSGMRIIGPNCIGVVSTRENVYPSFAATLKDGVPKRGRVALVTQSGAMGNALMVSLLRRGAGIAHWFTTGDEVNTGALELVAGLLAQDDVDAVGVFFEGMGDRQWLPAVREAIERTGKKVYVVKGAQTAAGRSAAAGHTGRVVGSGAASVSVMQEAGIDVLPTMSQLADTLVMTDLLGRLPGGRTAVVTVSGGCGVLAADAIVRSGTLVLSDLDHDPVLESRIGGRVHGIANPLDVAGSPSEIFADWANTIAERASTDLVIAIEANIMNDEQVLARELHRPADGTPIILVPFAEEDPISSDVVLKLAEKGIPVMPSADRAIAAAATMVPTGAGNPALRDEVQGPLGQVDEGVFGLEEAVGLCGEDLPWVPWAVVDSVADVHGFAESHGFPVVLKAAGRTLQHRSESGAVMVGVTESDLEKRFADLESITVAAGDAIIVQQQASAVSEIMISAMADPELGSLVIVRPGGVLTELIDGNLILWGGWDAEQRASALRRSIVGTLLSGYRGGPVIDLGPLGQLVERLIHILDDGRASFVEFNPVMVGEEGIRLVDALVKH